MDNIARNWDVAKLLKQHCSSHQMTIQGSIFHSRIKMH